MRADGQTVMMKLIVAIFRKRLKTSNCNNPHYSKILSVILLQTQVCIVEEQETNLTSQFIKFYFTSSMLNMFRTLIHPSSGACDFSIISPHCLCVLVSM